MQLLPHLKSLTFQGGELSTVSNEVYLDQELPRLAKALATLGFTAVGEKPQNGVTVSITSKLQENGYKLSVTGEGIRIVAFDDSSAFHALATLRQILIQFPTGIPYLEIEDWPDLSVRGFMLDISRCRVPTLASLYQLIDLLASLKYNQLQLYTEHTFAYRDHQEVWKNASPLTDLEIHKLDTYCLERFIELVPNQNSFGHMERWLRHPRYHHLAESPNGFEHPLSGWKDHGSTLKPTQESADFVDSLYQELLPNFRSESFNIGGDEPWELGQGFSKDTVSERGKTRVYLEHLLRIQEKVREHGLRMQFWGDIIINEPELAAELGTDVTALLWGYEVGHPFEEHCQAMRKADASFTVVPGTSTWNSIGGRLHTALPNIDAATENAKRFGANGLLLTEWGDNGHHHSPIIALIPILYAAAQAWDKKPNNESLAFAATNLIPNPVSNSEYDDLMTLGYAAKSFARHLHNQSWLNRVLFARPQHYAEIAPLLDASELRIALDQLATVSSENEIGLAKDLLVFAAEKGLSLIRQEKPAPIPKSLVDRFKSHWLEVSRPGGLQESVAHLLE